MREAARSRWREPRPAGFAWTRRSRFGRAIHNVAGGLSVFVGVWAGFLILLPLGRLLLPSGGYSMSSIMQTAFIDAVSWVLIGAVAVTVAGSPALVSDRWSSTLFRALTVAALLTALRLGLLFGLAGPLGWEFPASFPVVYLMLAPEHLLLMLAFFGTGYALAEARRSGAVELAGQRLRLQVARAEFQWQTLLLQPQLLLERLREIEDQLGSAPDRARESIRRLSTILRYDLSRAGSPVVAISDEASFIANYYARDEGGRHVPATLEIDQSVVSGGLHAPPLALFAFVTSVVEACRSASITLDHVRMAARADEHLMHIDLTLDGIRGGAALSRTSSIEVFRSGLQRRFGSQARLTFQSSPRALNVVLTLPVTRPEEEPDEPAGNGRATAVEVWPMGIGEQEAQQRGLPERFTRMGAAALIFCLYVIAVIPRNLMATSTFDLFSRATVVSAGIATTFVLIVLTAASLAAVRGESRATRGLKFVLAIALVALLVPLLQFAVQCAARSVVCTVSPQAFQTAPFLALMFYSFTVGLHAVYRARDRRREKLELSSVRARAGEARVLALKRQLNPHFLFNALNSVLGISLTRPLQASAMIRNLEELLRVVTTASDALMVPLREELRVLELYLTVEKGRFGDSLVTEIHVEPGLEEALVPHMILQPVVENAIRHGRSPGGGAAIIRIAATATGERLTLTVSDRGRGLSEGLVRTGGGVGLENSASRLRELFGARSSFHLHDTPGGGLTVELSLPLHMEESERSVSGFGP